MKKHVSIILNIIFFSLIIIIAFVIASSALVKKINDNKIQYDQNLKAAVVKQQLPILSFSDGVIKKIHIRTGQRIKKNDLLIELENPVLEGKIHALENHPDNVSAQTEADVAKEQMKSFQVYSPVDGVVTDVLVAEGSPVQTLTKMINLYSDDNVQLLAHLTNDQYHAIQQLNEIKAYSNRLNQEFVMEPDILQPNETNSDSNGKEIGLFFTFKDKDGAQSLLNNEDLELQLNQTQTAVAKPIDYLVTFWNSIFKNVFAYGKNK